MCCASMQYLNVYTNTKSIIRCICEIEIAIAIIISGEVEAVELTDYKDSESGQNNQNIAEEQEQYNR